MGEVERGGRGRWGSEVWVGEGGREGRGGEGGMGREGVGREVTITIYCNFNMKS